jgi:hypothetical protein
MRHACFGSTDDCVGVRSASDGERDADERKAEPQHCEPTRQDDSTEAGSIGLVFAVYPVLVT